MVFRQIKKEFSYKKIDAFVVTIFLIVLFSPTVTALISVYYSLGTQSMYPLFAEKNEPIVINTGIEYENIKADDIIAYRLSDNRIDYYSNLFDCKKYDSVIQGWKPQACAVVSSLKQNKTTAIIHRVVKRSCVVNDFEQWKNSLNRLDCTGCLIVKGDNAAIDPFCIEKSEYRGKFVGVDLKIIS